MKKYFIYGLILAILTIILFLIVYSFFIHKNYYYISLIISSFILPVIYIAFSSFLLYRLSRNPITFSTAFENSFMCMFIGGTLSIIFIYLFFTYFDFNANILLKQQYVDINKIHAKEAFLKLKNPTDSDKLLYESHLKSLQASLGGSQPFINLRTTLIASVFIYGFYVLTSWFLAIFFRRRK